MDSIKYQQIKNQQVTESVRNIIMAMFGSSNRTNIQTQTSKTTQKWVTEHKTKLLLCPVLTSDLNLTWEYLQLLNRQMEISKCIE